jgi:hypothetical protein
VALGNVFIKDVDGNIPFTGSSGNEKVTGLLFDVSLQPNLFTVGYGLNNKSRLDLNDVVYITSRKLSMKDFGIIERVDVSNADEENNENFFHGIPAYHIREFFRMSGNVDGNGKLYVMFADCSTHWDAVEIMQRAAGGRINQLGVWTEQPLWKLNGAAGTYNLNIVKTLNDKAIALAEQNQPLSLILSANPSNTGSLTIEGRQVNLNKIPSAICEASRISVIFGQAQSEKVSMMQKRNINNTPVGFLGAMTGAIAKANVQESVAWIKQFNLFTDGFQDIELGFGDVNLTGEDEFVSLNRYESLSPALLDELDEKGYIFPIKYAGKENGIYISKDQTCSAGDFRTVARNRTINKSRRAVREALLPYVNSPLMVNPATGFLAPSKITAFKTLIGDILNKMKAAQEISGYSVMIDPNQNVLVNDTLVISYFIVPVGVATKIYVEEGLSLTEK